MQKFSENKLFVMTPKKRIVISYHNLSVELQEELKRRYPLGFTDHMQRIDKGLGAFFYAVILEMEDVSYLVKVDVKIDGQIEDDEEKDYDDDEIKGADDIIDGSDSDEDDE